MSSYTAASLVAGTGTTNNPQYSDQYVAKHFPFPWFASLTGGGTGNPMGTPLTEPQASAGGGTNCDSNHIANLDDPNHGLIHDLNANTVPQFSWITPDNCSDAHDTTCKGNNLSGAFGTYTSGPHAGQVNLNDPIYNPPGLPADDPEATTPRNFTGGLYASDLFLAYYIPLIEQSSAYANGGLIDITFDEGEPSFTYSGNSFNNVLTNSSVVSGTPPMPAGQGTSSPLGSAPADAPSYGTPSSTAPGCGLHLRRLRHHRRHGRREHQRHQRQLGADRPELDTADEWFRRSAVSRSGIQPLHRPASRLHPDHADAGACRLRAGHRPG